MIKAYKSVLDFAQFVAASNQSGEDGAVFNAELEIAANTPAAVAALKKAVATIYGDEELEDHHTAITFGYGDGRSDVCNLNIGDDYAKAIAAIMAEELGTPEFPNTAPIEYLGFSEGNPESAWSVWTYAGTEDAEILKDNADDPNVINYGVYILPV